MKKKFSKAWKSSKQPRKQRKYRANAPLHIKRKMIASHLSKELREKYKRRSFPVRKNDVVKILRGSFKGKQGKVSKVDTKKMKVYVEGIVRTKKDGTKVPVPLDPSNLMIVSLNLEDKKRVKALERKLKEKESKENKEKGKAS
ncbi:MAG TPA: 50S ribosomal protein L24 [Candidatus Pacearchaeota archaeon]|nr:MAG: 50S ribosomal protein L24 [Candidatus Pacearchaeota archaeon ex4484_31]HDI03057.1 50S ribosomal protein L24 [Candidatus Pacearchaeota archaeon]